MPPITALLHTTNDALRLGRALETVLPCSEILVVDHGSNDTTRQIAREYGARIVHATSLAPLNHCAVNHYLDLARNDWIFCMEARESQTDGLQASLFEWAALPHESTLGTSAFSVFIRHEVDGVWSDPIGPEIRLVPRSWTWWRGRLPAQQPPAVPLEGELLRFAYP